ncbi:MAG: hypothetical protein ACYSWP_25205 [Planctomycetota bacterium]|jgi:hypothetical protein
MLNFFFSNFRDASKTVAKGSFFTGLFLIGFGMLIFILKDIFAFLAAAVFFIGGFSAIGYAIRLFWSSRKTHDDEAVRKNVTIHRDEPQ